MNYCSWCGLSSPPAVSAPAVLVKARHGDDVLHAIAA